MYEINKLHHGEGMCTACLKKNESFIQNSSLFSFRGEKRANFLRVRNPRNRIHYAWIVDDWT